MKVMRIIFGIFCTVLLTVHLSFGQRTDAAMKASADSIANETAAGGNTKVRIANNFRYLINSKPSLLGSYSNPSWITSLGWTKITSTPTTLSGYGIVDAQSTLVSGTNIKTVNGTTLLGSGDLSINSGVWGNITGTLSDQTDLNTALGLKATLASPTFTGTPLAPTAAPGTNTTQLSTTAFVQAAIAAASIPDGDKGDITVSGSGATWTIDNLAVTNAKINDVAVSKITGSGTVSGLTAGNVTTNANLTGPITSIGNATSIASSIALPGSPTTTTQPANDNSTKIATTAYVDRLSLTVSTGLTNTSGTLTADLATGKSGGQSVIGDILTGGNLRLSSTSHATKGSILFGTSSYNESANTWAGVEGIGSTYSITATATANNQVGKKWLGRMTSRATASDRFDPYVFDPILESSSTLIDGAALTVGLTYSGAAGGIATTATAPILTALTGMTATTYTNVAPASTTGGGTGALFTVIVGGGTSITSITLTTAGSGYKKADLITFNGSQFGSGSGSATYEILTTSAANTFNANATPLRIIHRDNISSTVSRRLIDFKVGNALSETTVGGIVNAFVGGAQQIQFHDNSGAFLTSIPGGVLFTRGSFSVGGSTATMPTVAATQYTLFALNNNYLGNQNIQSTTVEAAFTFNGGIGHISASGIRSAFQSKGTAIVGAVNTTGSLVGGTGYTNGSPVNQAMTGGTGTGATGNFTIAGGIVTVFAINNRGINYTPGDVLSCSTIGGGSGFTITVVTVDATGAVTAGFAAQDVWTDSKSSIAKWGVYVLPTGNITSSGNPNAGALYYGYAGTTTGPDLGVVIDRSTSKSNFGGTITNTHSTLQTSGSFATGYVAKTANYTATATDETIECTSGTFQVTLPTAVGITGRQYTIVNSGAGTITIGTTSSQTFVNFTATPTTLTMATLGTRVVKSNGTNWMLISSL